MKSPRTGRRGRLAACHGPHVSAHPPQLQPPQPDDERSRERSLQAGRVRADRDGQSREMILAGQALGVRPPGDPAVAWLAARQRGLATVAQLRICGLTRDAVRHRVAVGRLHRVHRGVYLVGHESAPEGARQVAAVLACGPSAALSHRSAGARWGICAEDREAVDVLSAARNSGSKPGIRFHRTGKLDAGELRVRDGVPLTAPARTLIDLAGLLPERQLERALDAAVSARLVRESALVAALTAAPRRPGTARLRSLLGEGQGAILTRSEAERRFLALLRAAELPTPLVNVRVGDYEVDALWREQRLAVEIDGYRFHAGRGAFERDRIRDADLATAGLSVRRFTWRRLLNHPEAVIATVARALERR